MGCPSFGRGKIEHNRCAELPCTKPYQCSKATFGNEKCSKRGNGIVY